MSLLALFDEFGQIVEPTPLDPSNPINAGLMLSFDGGITRTFDPVNGTLNTVNSTRLQASQDDDGLATGFGTTYGSTTSDRIDSTLTTDSTLITVQARVFINSFVASRILDKGTNGCAFGGGGIASRLIISRPYTGGQSPLYDFDVPDSRWFDVQFTWDSSGSALPVPYVNDDQVALITTTAPSGTFSPNASAWSIGNRLDGNNAIRWLPGMIKWLRIKRGIADAAEWQETRATINRQYARRALFVMGAVAGSSDVSMSSSVSASDSLAITTTIAASMASSVRASDSLSLDASTAVTMSSTVSAADSLAISTVIAASMASSVRASDSLTLTGITLSDAYERSSIDLSQSSVVGSGDATIVSAAPLTQYNENYGSARWLEPSFEVSGVNGLRPTFRILKLYSGVGGFHAFESVSGGWQTTRRPMKSYDNGLTWTYFDTNVIVDSGNQWVEFRDSAPFTQNTVRISRGRQISVHQVGDWVAAQAAAYPGVFVPTASAVAYTPSGSVSSYAAQSFIADEFDTQTDSLSRTIAKTPLYAGEINDTSVMPLDGSAKRVAYFSAGVHAGEDHGWWAARAFFDKIMGSSADAIALRRRYRIIVYPLTNAPGRAGGGWRGSWTQGTGGASDANRHYHDNAALDIVIRHKAALTTDRATGPFDWAIDFHAAYDSRFYIQSTFASSWHLRFVALVSGASGESVPGATGYLAGYQQSWLAGYNGDGLQNAGLGAKYATGSETGDPSTVTDALLIQHGEAFVVGTARTLAEGFYEAWGMSSSASSSGSLTLTETATLSGSATLGDITASGSLGSTTNSDISGSVSLGDVTASGSLASGATSDLSGAATLGDITAGGTLASTANSDVSGAAMLGDVSATGSLGGGTLPTKARPASDISAGGWTPSSGAILSDMVNEEVANPATFISTGTANSPCEMALNPTVYPGTASQTVSYDAFSSSGSTLTVNLRLNGTVIASWTHALTPVNTRYTQTLTPPQIALLGPTGVSIELIAS